MDCLRGFSPEAGFVIVLPIKNLFRYQKHIKSINLWIHMEKSREEKNTSLVVVVAAAQIQNFNHFD